MTALQFLLTIESTKQSLDTPIFRNVPISNLLLTFKYQLLLAPSSCAARRSGGTTICLSHSTRFLVQQNSTNLSGADSVLHLNVFKVRRLGVGTEFTKKLVNYNSTKIGDR